MTLEIQRILSGVGIRLIDHIIIAGPLDCSILSGVSSPPADAAPFLAADRPQQKLNHPPKP